jgi:hypothetical protein
MRLEGRVLNRGPERPETDAKRVVAQGLIPRKALFRKE